MAYAPITTTADLLAGIASFPPVGSNELMRMLLPEERQIGLGHGALAQWHVAAYTAVVADYLRSEISITGMGKGDTLDLLKGAVCYKLMAMLYERTCRTQPKDAPDRLCMDHQERQYIALKGTIKFVTSDGYSSPVGDMVEILRAS